MTHPAAPESVLGGGTVLGRRQEYGRPAPVSDGVAHPGVDECFERPAVMRAEEQDASDRTGMRPAERRPSLIDNCVVLVCSVGAGLPTPMPHTGVTGRRPLVTDLPRGTVNPGITVMRTSPG